MLGARLICGFEASVVCSPSKKIFDKKNSERIISRFSAGPGARTLKPFRAAGFQDQFLTNSDDQQIPAD